MAEGAANELKISFVGGEKVGKTSLIKQYTNGTFNPSYEATIGAAFTSKPDELNGKPVRLQIWDASGQQKYRSLMPMYYRSAAGVLLVYDITNELSFEDVRSIVRDIKQEAYSAVLMVVGNKCDLENARVVSREEAESFAEQNGCKFIETSACDNVNVHEMILDITDAILSKENN
ncbi:ras-related protein Rab-8B-like [Dysidea avara]|uniref:ras-related protein Rab-8B-like n=1 Tax=Dysidea avara TaxID=196820 RepID=UPI00331CEBDF